MELTVDTFIILIGCLGLTFIFVPFICHLYLKKSYSEKKFSLKEDFKNPVMRIFYIPGILCILGFLIYFVPYSFKYLVYEIDYERKVTHINVNSNHQNLEVEVTTKEKVSLGETVSFSRGINEIIFVGKERHKIIVFGYVSKLLVTNSRYTDFLNKYGKKALKEAFSNIIRNSFHDYIKSQKFTKDEFLTNVRDIEEQWTARANMQLESIGISVKIEIQSTHS